MESDIQIFFSMLRGRSFQPRSYVHPNRNFFTVDAKSFCARKFCYNSKASELPDGNIITVGVKSFRHAGLYPSLQSYVLTVGNIITVGVKQSVVPALFPELELQSQELYVRDVEEAVDAEETTAIQSLPYLL